MKKIITPFIHATFLLPILAVAMGSIEFMAQKFDLLPNYINVYRIPYVFIIVGIIVIFGIPWYWLANRLLRSIEKYSSPKTLDHFRQSTFYYFILCAVLITWTLSGFTGNEDDVYFLSGMIISLIAISCNYFFLFRRYKQFHS